MAVAPQGYEQKFRDLDAVWEHSGDPDPRVPHPATSMSGKHIAKAYFNSDKVKAHQEVVRDVIQRKWGPALQSRLIVPKWFVGYRPFSDDLAAVAADELGGLSAYSDPDHDYQLSDADFEEDDIAAVIADDMYTGGAVEKTIKRLQERGVRVANAVLCLANMSGNPNLGDREIIAAAAFEADPRSAADCPHCPIGSVPLLPRPNWDILQGRTQA